MKIINTVQATKKSVTAASGSTHTPIWKNVSPVGNQLITEVYGFAPRCSTWKARTKTTILPNQERKAAPTAIVWLRALLRFVNRTIRKNATIGGRGRSQIMLSVVISRLRSPFQEIDLVCSHGVAATIDRDEQRQANRHFRSRHSEDHHCKSLPGDQLRGPKTPESQHVDDHRVQHQLYPHQNGYRVLTGQHAV